LVGVLLALAGCRSEPPPQPAVRDEVERGPLKLVVEARPTEAWIGDPVELSIHVHTPADYQIRWPAPTDFGELHVAQVGEPARRPAADGGWDWTCRFRIETSASGTLEIPPLTVAYGRQTAPPATASVFDNELTSAALRVTVRSALTTQDSVANPRDITGTLMPRQSFWRVLWPWLVAAAVAGMLAGGATAWWRMRQRRRREPPPLIPEIWALQMLAHLQPEQVEAGRAREFYYELSEIIRSYIEKKFGLAAPEMTTEEFLAALARDRSALPYDVQRLRAFMEACDIVKYAAYHPSRQDAEHALGTARTFVHTTAAAVEQARQTTGVATGGQAA